jgi:hypothetical protein
LDGLFDDTATSTNMARPHGRYARGVRLIGHVPQSHWQTITLVAGLRHDAMVAPMVVEGPMTAEIFLAYVEQCLVPMLKRAISSSSTISGPFCRRGA